MVETTQEDANMIHKIAQGLLSSTCLCFVVLLISISWTVASRAASSECILLLLFQYATFVIGGVPYL